MAGNTVDCSATHLCRVCQHEKPLESFRKYKSGLPQSRCRDCQNRIRRETWHITKVTARAYRLAHREQYRQYDRTKFQRHRERIRLAGRERYAKNKPRKLAYNKAYYERNRVKLMDRRRQWTSNNSERVRERNRKYRQQNYEIVRACLVRYMARKNNLAEDFTPKDVRECRAFWDNKCAACATAHPKLCFDHWIPLASPQCPGTIPRNIIPLCQPCNSSKYASDPLDWLLRRFGVRRASLILAKVQVYFANVGRPSNGW